MDKQLAEKINQKIKDIRGNSGEILGIADSLGDLGACSNSFAYGIAIGRLYNSFYYQCRRIFKRDPTGEELAEFRVMLKEKQKEILDALGLD